MRRFKCLNPQCPQKTFVERIEDLARAKQRRTVGFHVASNAIAQALGGSAAARLSVKLGMPTSRDTFLRALRRSRSEVTMAPPAVVGIDDWAITRGHRYGTIVVDLRRHTPKPREAAQLADVSLLSQTQPAHEEAAFPLMAWDLDQRTVKNFVQAGEYPERSPTGSGPMLLEAARTAGARVLYCSVRESTNGRIHRHRDGDSTPGTQNLQHPWRRARSTRSTPFRF